MTLRLPTATLLVLVVLASCSSDSDGESTTSSISVTTEVTVATTENADVTSTTLADATASTDATATTDSPTTSTTVPVEEQVRAAAIASFDSYWQCLRAPAECDVAARTIAGSDAFNAFTRTIDDLVSGGLYVGPEDVGYMVIESIEPMQDHTLVTSCWWSTGVLYVQPAVEGEPPVIQNNTPGTLRQKYEFVQDPADGQWKIRRGDVIEQFPQENRCAPEE